MTKIFIDKSFYCDLNLYLTAQVHTFFLQNGYSIVKTPKEADAIIINTCGLDGWREKRASLSIDSLLPHAKEGKKVVVFGCLTKVKKELLNNSLITAIGPKDLEKFNVHFEHKIPIQDLGPDSIHAHHRDRGDKYHIVIGQGCNNSCSYCSRKLAKGSVNSKPISVIVNEFKTGLVNGYKRFVLLADDCASYGTDLGTDLAELLNCLYPLCRPGILIDLTNTEPQGFITVYPKINKKIFRYNIGILEIPLQSVSPGILRAMNRNYSTGEIIKVVKEIRSLAPAVHFETHIIYGFPSETRQDLINTFSLKNVFDEITYLFYSPRDHTRARHFKDKVSVREMILRTFLVWKESQKQSRPMINFGYYGLPVQDIYKAIMDEYKQDDSYIKKYLEEEIREVPVKQSAQQLRGKVALVTGGAGGIGSAIVRELIAQGASVALHYNLSEKEALYLVDEIRELSGRCSVFQADITDISQVERMLSQVKSEFGRVDILVNNAAIECDLDIVDIPSAKWQRVIDTNLSGVLYLTRSVVKSMINNKGGRIINISSICAIKGFDGNTAYSATKSALIGFTRALARELGPYNILVNSILPGLIDAGMSKRMIERIGHKATENIVSRIPVQRAAGPEEVAYLAAFLASDKASFITGQNIIIDGGFSC